MATLVVRIADRFLFMALSIQWLLNKEEMRVPMFNRHVSSKFHCIASLVQVPKNANEQFADYARRRPATRLTT